MSDELTAYREHQFIRLGGTQYPRNVSPKCRTCRSPHRMEIEASLIKGYGYSAIAKSLPEPEDEKQRVSKDSIRAHLSNGHMTLDKSVQRAMIEARASEIGRDLEGEATLVDHVSLARLGVQQVFERIADGDLQPDVKDGIAFANLLMKAGMYEGSDVDQQSMVEAFGAYMDAAEAVMSQEQMRQFAQMLAHHPVLRALHSREAQRGLGGSDIVDAEIVEEEPAE